MTYQNKKIMNWISMVMYSSAAIFAAGQYNWFASLAFLSLVIMCVAWLHVDKQMQIKDVSNQEKQVRIMAKNVMLATCLAMLETLALDYSWQSHGKEEKQFRLFLDQLREEIARREWHTWNI